MPSSPSSPAPASLSARTEAVAQLLSLLLCAWTHAIRGTLGVLATLANPLALLRPERHPGADFYVGRVAHSRKYPVRRRFAYPLRLALIDLDAPPPWFLRSGQADDHLGADECRARCGANGPVKLLTSPWTFGYAQNPISVYYCFDEPPEPPPDRSPSKSSGDKSALSKPPPPLLRCCVAEVTNTPWGERVRFDFDPRGQRVPKSLHVSPFMDAEGDWDIRTTLDADAGAISLHVDVVDHPVFGDYFAASLVAERESDASGRRHARNERAGLRTLLEHGLSPHRVAFRIYHQAAKVLLAGVPFYPPPGLARVREKATRREEALMRRPARGAPAPGGGCPLRSTWREARAWPWKT